MEIIFLDIDGVLNTPETKEVFNGEMGMQSDLVQNFNRITKSLPKVKVVLCSTWRHDSNWKKTMQQNGLDVKNFVDKTGTIPGGGNRGQEIDAWVKKHDVKKFCILDDKDDNALPGMKAFQIHHKTGLTPQIADKVIAYFK